MHTAWITDIQRFSLYDGPGIRTTVFLKGCPLHCRWCHNPECIRTGAQLRWLQARCIGCGRCSAACPNGAHMFEDGQHTLNRELCTACGACAQACPVEALLPTGREVTLEDVLRTVLADKRYYDESGGGLTISGGEPLMQPAFTRALLTAAKEAGVHTAVETCGHASPQELRSLLPVCDLFLLDCKETDAQLHKKWTGVDNRLILENMDMLMRSGASVILRCPIIPGCNDREDHFDGLLALLRRYPALKGCELMAYHRLGNAKYRELGLPPAHEADEMTQARKDEILTRLQAHSSVSVSWG